MSDSAPVPAPAPGPGLSLKKASTACTACQTRKSKCTGGHPCDRCRARGTECVVDESTDGRRKMAIKKKQQEWENDRDMLRQLIETLRDGNEGQTAYVMDVIRSNASLEEIKLSLDAQSSEIERSGPGGSPDTAKFPAGGSPPQSERVGSSRMAIMDMHRLVDTPLFNVPASPWTAVTTDDQLVSHLVSLWFTWFAPWLTMIDPDAFIRDMQSGNLHTEHCSPFLVNAMLAHACPYSDYTGIKTTAAGVSDLMEQFLAEAKQWLDQEAGRVSVASVQGLGILYNCVSSMGKDRQGFVYMRQLSDMMQELSLDPGYSDTMYWSQPHAARALDRCSWALWMSVTSTCLAWHRLPFLTAPTRNRPFTPAHDDPNDMWVVYPHTEHCVPAHSRCLFDAYANLMPYVADAMHLLFAQDAKSTSPSFEASIEAVYRQLDRWYSQIPGCLMPTDNASFPILFLHLYYHHLIMIMFSYVRAPSADITSDSKGKGISNTLPQRAHDRRVESALTTARLFSIHRNSWGMARTCETAIQWAAVALFTLLDEDVHEPRCKESFIELCTWARSLARRWPLAKGILRLIQLTALKKQKKVGHQILPAEAEEIFNDFETRLWRASAAFPIDIHRQFSSFYPNLTEIVRENNMQQERQLPLPEIRAGGRIVQSPSSERERHYSAVAEGESPPLINMDQFLEKYDAILTFRTPQVPERLETQ